MVEPCQSVQVHRHSAITASCKTSMLRYTDTGQSPVPAKQLCWGTQTLGNQPIAVKREVTTSQRTFVICSTASQNNRCCHRYLKLKLILYFYCLFIYVRNARWCIKRLNYSGMWHREIWFYYLNREAGGSLKTSESVYQTTRRHVSDTHKLLLFIFIVYEIF
jgi:hypothetical protein